MGTWGTGLYSDDFASDLRTSVAAICRLPFKGEQIVELLADLNPEARNPHGEGFTTFWLVVADQLHRRGIRSPAQERAIDIIAKRTNLEELAKLGMTGSDLKARERELAARRLSSLPGIRSQLAAVLGKIVRRARKSLRKSTSQGLTSGRFRRHTSRACASNSSEAFRRRTSPHPTRRESSE